MAPHELAVAGMCATSGVAWASAASRRAPEGLVPAAVRGLLAGAGAFGLALAAYDLLEAAGLAVRWQGILAGGAGAALLAAVVGLVEESAKAAGILLALPRGATPAAVRPATVAVAAAFAALETAVTLGAAPSGILLARAALAPVAHAVLAAPVGLAIAAGVRDGGRRWLLLAPALAASAALHALADLSLASSRFAHAGYAAALAAPAVGTFLALRRVRPAQPPTSAASSR